MARHSFVLLAVLAVSPLSAQDAPRPFEFTGDIGLVNTAGNTDVTTLNVGEKLTHNRDRLTLKQFFAVVYGRTEGLTTTSLWRGGLRGDYALSPRIGVFGSATADRNRFAGISRRLEEGAGITFKLIAGERNKLEVEAGLAFTQQLSTTEVKDNFTSARSAALFQHNFTPTAYFLQTVEVLPNLEVSEDLRINTETGLVAPLSRRLAIKVSYVIRYDRLPEPTFEKTDRLLTSGLQVTL